ncbi:hypothetical protein CDAR_290051 [Caerostris darwini]|uniref:Uncharacterized protein n=1 Tax=Caerostris darwini TaxID=1538125 RepID=A0AAV4WXB7_9ARAC|nr:hypothetical protein CDAR_290051 [Caerostris darwini]
MLPRGTIKPFLHLEKPPSAATGQDISPWDGTHVIIISSTTADSGRNLKARDQLGSRKGDIFHTQMQKALMTEPCCCKSVWVGFPRVCNNRDAQEMSKSCYWSLMASSVMA